MLELILEQFRAEIVFTLSFFLAFLGVGYWLHTQFWPWYVEYQRLRLEAQKERHQTFFALVEKVNETQDEFRRVVVACKERLDVVIRKQEDILAALPGVRRG